MPRQVRRKISLPLFESMEEALKPKTPKEARAIYKAAKERYEKMTGISIIEPEPEQPKKNGRNRGLK